MSNNIINNICNSDTIFTQDLVRAGFSWDIRHVSVDSGYAAWPAWPPLPEFGQGAQPGRRSLSAKLLSGGTSLSRTQ